MNFDAIKNDLKSDEGIVLHEYKDHLGYSTIGIGRLIDERRGGGITLEEAEYLLENDISKVYDQLDDRFWWFRNMPAQVKRALINMGFQLGVNGLANFKKMIAMLNAGNYQAAADEALDSRWAVQTPQRAQRVTELMRLAVQTPQRAQRVTEGMRRAID